MENKTRKDGGNNVSEGRSEAVEGMKKERFRGYARSEIADSERFGNLAVRIYANETHAGEVIFKVELLRLYSMPNGSGEAFNYEECDLRNGIRGLKWALVWLWRARKRRHQEKKRSWY